MDKDNINTQILLSVISITAIGISIVLLINNREKLNNKEFLDNPYDINFYNRLLLTIVFSMFLVTNYKDYIKAKEKGLDLKPFVIQIYASILILIATVLSLYVAYIYKIGALENPDI